MKKQILFIHGGEVFDDYDLYIENLENGEFNPRKEKKKEWGDSLEDRLGSGFEVMKPTMPSPQNAKYREWKIWFEKTFPYLQDNIVLIGHSLGGIFLAKYLSENNFPKKILATYLIAAPYDAKGTNFSLADFILPDSLEKFEAQGGQIYLYHSKDDFLAPFANIDKYAEFLPKAKKVILKGQGHFIQEEFPELVSSIRQIYK